MNNCSIPSMLAERKIISDFYVIPQKALLILRNDSLILIGFLYFTETMRSKLSVTVYLFLALYGVSQNIKNFLCK
jgi:hypothetical protein